MDMTIRIDHLGGRVRKRFAQFPLLLALAIGVAGCGGTEPEPTEDALVAATQAGKVRGYVEDDVLVFKGIRYGADTATTRFKAPAKPEPWSGVKDATAYGNSIRQIPTGSGGGLFLSWAANPAPPMSEDCLFLNVWTPALRDGGKRPVLVWFHGGGFSSGSGSSNAYDGVRLVKRGDVVVVTVNHRLNIWGHLYLAEFGERFDDSGNAGILDLVQSLEWVRDNIEEFGGDPGNVLIFGESGGGMKVTTLMAMDAARGLFHRAVVQSGPYLSAREPADAVAGAARVVEALGLDAATIDRILTMPAAEIEEKIRSAGPGGGGPSGFGGPVVDGRNLTRHPFTPDAPPQSADVPMMIGTTRTEMSLLAGARRPELFDLTWETLPMALAQTANGRDVEAIIATYRDLHPEIGPAELAFTAMTDGGFLNSSMAQADRKAEQPGAPAYVYLLNWDTPVDGGKWFSPHALDIGMVFDNVAKSESMSGVGEEQQRIADQMSEAWLAFARTGNPNHPGIPEWPRYDVAERPVMVFDLEPKVLPDPHGTQRKLFLDE